MGIPERKCSIFYRKVVNVVQAFSGGNFSGLCL